MLVGANPIQTLEDETTEALVATEFYGATKRRLLAEYPWRFAVKIVSLAEDATPPPASIFTYAYHLPSDAITVRSIIEQAASIATPGVSQIPPRQGYEIVGSKLMCNLSPCYLEYTANVDESEFPPHFIEALVNALASAFAMPITESAEKSAYFADVARTYTGRAKIIDGQQRPEQPMHASDFIRVRM